MDMQLPQCSPALEKHVLNFMLDLPGFRPIRPRPSASPPAYEQASPPASIGKRKSSSSPAMSPRRSKRSKSSSTSPSSRRRRRTSLSELGSSSIMTALAVAGH
ncbi:hypothetical protein OBBRIDRAFT_798094 [Obba rivulosa]|uniref:Uncharacterized protein n=1 Tax=Obba rivulosa TaxID=1052685 RepID=A0A8E2AJ73_9APHY|nr:hypothetical protein OBBRIDRAFT_798094 [Obba rivulosa]